ncbi:uroporphyrin-III C-methyltransferase/precorrin-2 dehydrogenase/sirohydrochlorin ferrochelatase [Sphingobium sp. B2D3A]|uniref:siroheme synthase n=1 Tax=unclassified Sphingobium TaxID=2611147 RepID=UPI002224520B|nr:MULTISPECIES: NAD(P)-dependent oxidoreductase [unclassified Sphingobium]MCW2336528.1 uroporphyrin-III C-methyltransferase/precorrin-2 dehydrogenase/sirohydrochlorin ferrochelatase [Sphingobium sp. B2D3A]MCW2368097.1 uroporphyrin-III C-methyltransferase/precorrin-2 dehydrogenase/sirohydrochlorin ferrochelatase [Sphingobium sp. B11D3D]MCW2386282.1 uroporphyrin-III C-methyltransferase/precorrin-2 dehydrogenase/sirohydrochlorin ferrochelatase [Sphingobium sp. B2D3D]MCW2392222.1 uroporphyrin-III 
MHSLPLFVILSGQPVILLGTGEAADAKRRLIERAGGVPVADENATARIAFVALEDETAAQAAADRLKARGLLVNVVDRPALCDFTTPAIVDRDPVLIAVSTGGASSGLAAALRQRLETILPARLGALASALNAAKVAMREAWPDARDRRRALGEALAPGGMLDPFGTPAVDPWLEARIAPASRAVHVIALRSDDPDDLTVREARTLGQADRILFAPDTPPAILARARADAERLPLSAEEAPPELPGLTVWLVPAED